MMPPLTKQHRHMKTRCQPAALSAVREARLKATRERIDKTQSEFIPLFTGPSTIAGTGLFTGVPIKRNTKIAEYLGENISKSTWKYRVARDIRNGITAFYIFQLVDGSAIDARNIGSVARFVNHSCDANLVAREVKGRIFYYARKNIDAGTELTLNYHPDGTANKHTFECHCGTRVCVGQM